MEHRLHPRWRIPRITFESLKNDSTMDRVKSIFNALELNPIVVKELRQAVRSWAVVGTLLLFLIVLFFTVVGFSLT